MTNLVAAKGCSLSNKHSKQVFGIPFVILWILIKFLVNWNPTCDYYANVIITPLCFPCGLMDMISFFVSGLVRPAMRIPLILSDELNVTCSLSIVLAGQRIKQFARNSSNGSDTINKCAFHDIFRYKRSFLAIPSLWHVSCWMLCSLFNGVNYAVEAKRNDSIAMNLATPSNFREVRSPAIGCWHLRGFYTPLRPPGSSQCHRRPRVDIIHGCGWLKACIGPSADSGWTVFRHACIFVFFRRCRSQKILDGLCAQRARKSLFFSMNEHYNEYVVKYVDFIHVILLTEKYHSGCSPEQPLALRAPPWTGDAERGASQTRRWWATLLWT